MVEKKAIPPGLSNSAQASTTASGAGTCSSISRQVTTSNCCGNFRGQFFGGVVAVIDIQPAL